jgi:glycerophosphoryl diester phosphodiesterase
MNTDAQEKEIAIVAHRGFWNCEQAGHAKNSIAALKEAQENGFWGSEFDVNMTKDGQLLIFHDAEVSGKRIDKNPASAFSGIHIKNGEPIPTMDEFLKQAVKHPETMLVFELKIHSTKEIETEAVKASIEKLKEYGVFSPDRVMFISFSKHICMKFAELAPGFTVQYLDSSANPNELIELGINGIDTHYTVLLSNRKKYKDARKNGMSVNTWTVNNKNDIIKMIRLGVDQITTDNPLLVRSVLPELGIKEKKAE